MSPHRGSSRGVSAATHIEHVSGAITTVDSALLSQPQNFLTCDKRDEDVATFSRNLDAVQQVASFFQSRDLGPSARRDELEVESVIHR